MIPTLRTERLVLRPYARGDFDAYASFMGSKRAVHMGGPIDRDKAWTWFTNDIASWPLYGFGTLAMEIDGRSVVAKVWSSIARPASVARPSPSK
ncbi:MAG: hypothetical protein AAFQ09_12015, partial [Pseudomonadota bacterium]